MSLIFFQKSEGGPQNTEGRLHYLDGWRGIAISCVLIAHFFQIKIIDLGRFGVDIFFVLSGMLMADILFVKRMPLIRFYKRRLNRIFPVFLVFLLLISLASYLLGLSNEHKNFIYNLLFIRAYFPTNPDIWNAGIPIGHLWSLNVEEHCYLLLSLVTLVTFFKGKEYLPILVLGFIPLILHYVYIIHPSLATPNYHLRTEIVASHLLISAGYALVKERFEKYVAGWMPLVAFCLAFLCYTPLTPHWTAKWLVSPFLLAFTVNHLNTLSDLMKSLLCLSPLRFVGLWSFSIYIWQQPFYYYGTRGGDLFQFAGPVFLVVSLVVGIGSYYLVENPARQYLNQRW